MAATRRASWLRLPRNTPLRTKLLAIVFLGALVPLGAVGAWLARSTQRSAEESLRARLDTTLVRASQVIGMRWVRYRSALLDLSENSLIQRALMSDLSSHARSTIAAASAGSGFASLRTATQIILVRDRTGVPIWAVDADASGAPILVPARDSLRLNPSSTPDVLSMSAPVHASSRGGASVGAVEARLQVGALVPSSVGSIAGAGAVLTLVDRDNGSMVAPLPFDAALLRRQRFTWGGEDWLTSSLQLDDPHIEILAAAPLAAFMVPFDRAARSGLFALAIVISGGFLVVGLLMRRVTQSLVELARAADAVGSGDLERRVVVDVNDEVGRVGMAFNTMTERLHRTLAQLSQRQAVAAVGEFASALAHEIRNPLSAMRLNLQRVEERLSDDASLREPVSNALRDIARLERTLASALRLARTGSMHMESLRLAAVLEAALRAVEPEVRKRGLTFEYAVVGREDCVRGNAAALEQLFLNLFLNAAQATPSGGRLGITSSHERSFIHVSVWDTGPGFSAEARERAFEPLFTTKPEGTGLGLAVAKRIVVAHAGRIDIGMKDGHGAVVLVALPLVA